MQIPREHQQNAPPPAPRQAKRLLSRRGSAPPPHIKNARFERSQYENKADLFNSSNTFFSLFFWILD